MDNGRLRSWFSVGLLLLLTLGMFGDVLAAGESRLLSLEQMDIWAYFYWIREWGFKQLARGNLALWNPHILCGSPFFGSFQPALLYPPNVIFLLMSATRALNLCIALHIFLAGLFTFFWGRSRGLSHSGAVVAGVLFMFCGACFHKIFVGHVALVCAASWLPLILLCVDKLLAGGRFSWALLGGVALAMQFLGGSPQYTYYTALTAGLYTLLNLGADRQHLRRSALGLFLIYALAGLLCAGQIIPGAQLESMRSEGLEAEKAAVGAMSAARFLTVLAPAVFDTDILSLHLSAAGLLLAGYGAIAGEKRLRRFSGAMVLILCVLAAGNYTPLGQLLHDYFPGFRFFRVVGRFGVFASVFLAMLAGVGFDRLRQPDSRPRRLAVAAVVLALLTSGLAGAILATVNRPGLGVWGASLRLLDKDGEVCGGLRRYTPEKATWSAHMLLVSGGCYLAVAGVLLGVRRFPRAVYGIGLLMAGELFGAALNARDTMEMPLPIPTPWLRGIRSLAKEERSYHVGMGMANRAMHFGTYDASGYDAVVLQRYYTLHQSLRTERKKSPSDIRSMVTHTGLWQMLRVRYFMAPHPKRAIKFADPMRRLELIEDYRVLPSQEEVLTAIKDTAFDPRKIVYLESEPSIRPAPGARAGSAKVLRLRTDQMDLEADLPQPGILLITESYSRHWHATPLPGSCQESYQVMPANLVLRAIPLQAGKHRLRLFYRPPFFVLGMCISGITAMGCVLAGGGLGLAALRRRA